MMFEGKDSALKLSRVSPKLSRTASGPFRTALMLLEVWSVSSEIWSVSSKVISVSRLSPRVSKLAVDTRGVSEVGVVLEVTCTTGTESVCIYVDVSSGVAPGVGDWEGVDNGGVVPGSGDCEGVDFGSVVFRETPRMNPSWRSSSSRPKSYS